MGPVKQKPARFHNVVSFAGPVVLIVPILAVVKLTAPILTAALLTAAPLVVPAAHADDAVQTNPLLGDEQAIKDGGRLFRQRCTGCHWNPLRGPRIFQTKRPYEQFVDIVTNGKQSQRTMPPFGSILSRDDISRLHAYLMSRERP